MKWIAVTLLAFSIPAMAAGAKLSGNWKLVSDINGTTRVSACTFTQDGANVKGVCKRDDVTREFSGTVDDKGVHLAAKAEYEGTPINVTYEAKFVDDNTIKGSVDVEPADVEGSFTLTRQ